MKIFFICHKMSNLGILIILYFELVFNSLKITYSFQRKNWFTWVVKIKNPEA